GTQALIDARLADPSKLVIMGGSAGGFTVLNALIHHPGFFKLGISRYGVSNLFMLEEDTHKFESHYNTSLLGALPEHHDEWQARSPVFHADKIRDALLIFQGSADPVVPQAQSDNLVEQLKANNVPHLYRVYEGEGHGFRQAENLTDYYNTIDAYLKEMVIGNSKSEE
ncbi:MAG TPA: prolyl oligopeptidase family serine peptidase, partial [Anaerolineaceae bacterium]|nr:prolyl oligopeptidase family serine peptidase [Anaerolineaceae bacterium]